MSELDLKKQFARVGDQRVHFVDRTRSGFNWMKSLPIDPDVRDPIVEDDELHDSSKWVELTPDEYLPVE